MAVSAAATESASDAAGAAEQGAPLEDLGLLDAHTTIDLMQVSRRVHVLMLEVLFILLLLPEN